MTMVRYSSLTTAIRWWRMCSAYTIPRSQPTDVYVEDSFGKVQQMTFNNKKRGGQGEVFCSSNQRIRVCDSLSVFLCFVSLVCSASRSLLRQDCGWQTYLHLSVPWWSWNSLRDCTARVAIHMSDMVISCSRVSISLPTWRNGKQTRCSVPTFGNALNTSKSMAKMRSCLPCLPTMWVWGDCLVTASTSRAYYCEK